MSKKTALLERPAQSKFLRVEEVADLLEISESHAYKVMQKLNNELKAQGKIVTAGRVSKRYLAERVYC